MTGYRTRYSKRSAYAIADLAKLAYYSQSGSRLAGALDRDHDMTLLACVNDRSTDTQGYVAANARAVAVVFRGTESARDLVTDVVAVPARTRYGGASCRVHRGFRQSYASVRSAIRAAVSRALDRPRTVLVAGHSLGGALATLAAVDLAVRLEPAALASYTYGSPRVGDERFADVFARAVPNAYRVVHGRDAIVGFPAGDYVHVGAERRYDADGRLIRGASGRPRLGDHHIRRYLAALAPR